MAKEAKQQVGLDLSITGELASNAVKSVRLSKRFTQILVRCSIFNIIHRRLPLDESELKTRKYKNIPFVVLKSVKNIKDPLLVLFYSWLDGIKDAFEKNYLKEIFIFMKSTSGEVMETYQFKLKYNTDPEKEHRRTLIYVQDDTMALLQVIRDLEKNPKLDRDNVKLVIELTYSDVTPAEYEPPGFESARKPNCAHISVCEKLLGTLNTGFHKLTCRAQGLMDIERGLTPLPTSLPEENEKESTSSRANESTSKKRKLDEEIIEAEDIEPPKLSKMDPQKFNNSNITISDQNNSLLSNDDSVDIVPSAGYIHCICQLVIPMEIDVEIIRCAKCARQFHAACCGYKNKGHDNFLCSDCGTMERKLINLSSKDRIIFVRVRLMLYFLDKIGELPEEIINLFGESHQQDIIEKLEQYELYDFKNENLDRKNLDAVMSLFFNTDDSQFLN
ncbi:hypothetical protein JTB14_000438 [Gonioctena quinquepunctata]|nr:hypothetical protein JTB14_000438 [Gonioctena quinquepunctata]